MKNNYKRMLGGMIAVAVVFSPFVSFAALPQKEQKFGNMQNQNFCTNFDKIGEKVNLNLKTKIDKFSGNKGLRMGNLEEKRNLRDQKIDTKRQELIEKRDLRFDSLISKADTDIKKKAVSDYQNAVKEAVTTKQANIDKAMEIFRAGVDSLVKNKFSLMDTRAENLKKATDSALAVAKTSCVNGTDPVKVREAYRLSIKNAHDTFKADKSDVVLKNEINKLITVKNESIKKAMDEFKASLEKARLNLKTAFGE